MHSSQVRRTGGVAQTVAIPRSDFGAETKIVRSGNGEEYTAASLRQYFEHRGIIHQFTASYTPEQNGKAERLNHTLTETTRAMLLSSHLRTFGARMYVMRHDINKLEARCSPGLLLGYAATSKAYRMLLDDGRIFTSTNVVMHEGEIRLVDSSDDREDSADEEVPGRGDFD
jgi:transposase InsO family protein